MALGTGQDLPVSGHFYKLCRGVIGVLAAAPLAGVPLRDLAHYLIPGLVSAVVIIGIGFAGGLMLARHSGVSRETGVLSMLAGGASIMTMMASEFKADMRYVTLAQYLRVLAVSATLPFVASLLPAPGENHLTNAATPWWMWIAVLVIAVVGDPVARFLRIPAPSVFGPLLITAAIAAFSPVVIIPPTPLAVMAFLSIGWVCGGGINVPALKRFARLLPATIAFIIVIMSACAAMGVVISHWLGISYFEGYLATSPGAIETVLALSTEGGAGPAVIACQLIRLLCILVFAGALPTILRKL
ncbi:Putative ammonia monooxygenase [Corynebacterium aquatimens]|uniref:Membrane AbrB-like protein n=2 Tax=Corynebacterium aquatimens TaxID=1190508 RepID=A0A931E1Q7_9CORY|nr:membrane AbrB-like protein [Corynebacterium aquatimens]WJY64842.1 Putative ammonia monooxygenase [Corynebacterium aquatimens]